MFVRIDGSATEALDSTLRSEMGKKKNMECVLDVVERCSPAAFVVILLLTGYATGLALPIRVKLLAAQALATKAGRPITLAPET